MEKQVFAIALEQIIDPESGEVIAFNRQLLSTGDMERIIAISGYTGFPTPQFRSYRRQDENRSFYCYFCNFNRRKAISTLTGYNIRYGMSCTECEHPHWIMVGS